jgi:uncharacterized membrane protein
MAGANRGLEIGRRIAPPRFLLFVALVIVGLPIGHTLLGWREGAMLAFDVAAAAFLIAVYPLLCSHADEMREASKRNDANRAVLLAIVSIVMLAILVAVAAELSQKGAAKPATLVLIVSTLALAWTFTNTVYALHYAHLFYQADRSDGVGDLGGIEFPKTPEPDYWDFVYFSFCLGMTFQVSDMNITSSRIRKVVTAHCLAAFVFNLGILAFTINVLGGG